MIISSGASAVPKPRRNRVLRAAFALVALCISGEAQAQMVDRAQFQKYLASEFHNQLVNKALAVLPPEIFKKCPALESPDTSVSPVRQIAFGADGIPNAGDWWEHFPVKGCGNDTTLNLNFSIGADGKIQTTIGLPGTTHANLVLQHDAVFYANVGPRLRVKDCKQFLVTDTRFEGFGLKNPATPDPGAEAKFRPWWETWTVTGCGHRFDVPLNFSPDATGTGISQKNETITER
jgi:hypothetical protein